VGSSGVVVLGVPGQDGAQVSFAGDEDAVGAFGARCSYPPLGECVGLGALRRGLDDGRVVAAEDGVECVGELRVAIADEEPETPGSVSLKFPPDLGQRVLTLRG
jgi:hypothetical protein